MLAVLERTEPSSTSSTAASSASSSTASLGYELAVALLPPFEARNLCGHEISLHCSLDHANVVQLPASRPEARREQQHPEHPPALGTWGGVTDDEHKYLVRCRAAVPPPYVTATCTCTRTRTRPAPAPAHAHACACTCA